MTGAPMYINITNFCRPTVSLIYSLEYFKYVDKEHVVTQLMGMGVVLVYLLEREHVFIL